MNTILVNLILFFLLSFSAILKAEVDPQWLQDGKLALGEDLKEKFRAKDRLKDLDHLDDLLQRELSGPYQRIVLELIRELKVRSLLPNLKSLCLENENRFYYEILNSITTKDDLKLMKSYYQFVKKKKKKSFIQGFIEFYDLYNQPIEFDDLAEFYQTGDESDKEKVADYLISKLDSFEYSQVSFFVNTALNSAPLKTKIILMEGFRRLPDPQIKKYSINFKKCEKDSDKVLADLCHRLWLYSEKK